MSDLNELFAELKNEMPSHYDWYGSADYIQAMDALYVLDAKINNGEFARAEQDAYIG